MMDDAASWAKSPGVRRIMQGNVSRDTKPELRVRQILHARGLRYRVHFKLPGMPRRRADIAFPRQQVAIFIDGCFWHGCSEHFRLPKTNVDYWEAKTSGNRERDRNTDQVLAESGWHILRFWAHEDPETVAAGIAFCVHGLRGG